MELKKITFNDIVRDNKTLKECLEEDFDGTKKWVFERIREHELPEDDVLEACHIKRIVHEPTVTQIAFDRVIKKDTSVYKKDTAKLEKIIQELNTLDNGETEE